MRIIDHVRSFLSRRGYPPMPTVQRVRLEPTSADRHGGCAVCRRTWREAEPHVTDYSWGRGCFTLCEACCAPLTPSERLPFYLSLWRVWDASAVAVQTPWPVIAFAVLHEPLSEAQLLGQSDIIRAWKEQLEAVDLKGWENEGGALAA